MEKYICSICGYIYDEALGDPGGGIAPGTKWQDLPEDWICPLCGATKDSFEEEKKNEQPDAQEFSAAENNKDEFGGLSLGELGALFYSLSKGCDKQHLAEESGLFAQLAEYYKGKVGITGEGRLSDIEELAKSDLDSGYPNANLAAADAADRGALRALAWGEKVTRMLSSLLERYEKQQHKLLEGTRIYVCDICGFVYLGDEAPETCPVCKVPKMKITEVKRG